MHYQILVSGSSANELVPRAIFDHAKKLGVAISEAGATLLVDEMYGISYRAAIGARTTKKRTKVIGFSPAVSRHEHDKTYRLPMDEFDSLIFTGGEYVGRTTLAARSADAVIIVGGELASLQQIAIGIELGKVCGVITGSGGVANLSPQLLESLAPRQRELLVSDSSPARLVKKIIAALDEKYA